MSKTHYGAFTTRQNAIDKESLEKGKPQAMIEMDAWIRSDAALLPIPASQCIMPEDLEEEDDE